MDYSSTGAMRSPFSPRVRQSITGRRPIGLSSSKKNQSKFMQGPGELAGDVVYKTPITTIETYGMPLPVMVTEALTFASGEVSVRLSSCGWCWVVSGRRIISWPRTSTASSAASPAPTSTIARELSLPQTDLAHKADLVVLFYMDGAQMPSCIGVSPEGTVRYWPSVGQEGVYIDVSCELAGQECDKLGDYTPEGLVLATTTCTVVLLNPTVVEGRPTVACRTLRPPSGWLGGIGRRVSLLFFGSMPAHADTKLVGVVMVPGAEGTVALVAGGPAAAAAGPAPPGPQPLVAAGPVLQLWRGAELHEHSLRRVLADSQLAPQGDLNSLEIMALDVRANGNNCLLLLIATVNVARSPEMRYAIVQVCVSEASRPRVTSLCSVSARDTEPPRLLPLPHRAILYTTKYVALVSTIACNDKVDYIDVSSEGDKLLAAELCDGVPLLFTHKHGVLALIQPDAALNTPSMCESPMGSPCPSDMYEGNLSLYEIDPHEVAGVATDACGRVQTAFLFHVRREAGAARAALAGVDAGAGAGAVLRAAAALLDDAPAGDPRWRRTTPDHTAICLGSSAALQVHAQLRDKQRAFSLFCDFLRAVGLWQRLGDVPREDGGGMVSTESVLGGLAEQLAIAIALRRLQQGADAQLIDAAIYQVVCGDNPEVEEEPEVEAALSSGALSPTDVFYRRVTRVQRVLRALALAPPPAHDARAAAAHAAATINILTNVLSAVQSVRAQWQASVAGAGGAGAASAAGSVLLSPQLGPRALMPALCELLKRAVTVSAHKCPEATLRAQVYEASAALADLVLTDAQHLATHLYHAIRRDAIQPFIDEGQLERAAALAEKFKELELLVEMCIDNDDMDKLYAYIHKYTDEGMAEMAFARLAERGRVRALLAAGADAGAGAGADARLRGWLRAGAGARAALLALHEVRARRPARAAAALLLHAHHHAHRLQARNSAASLAKLCLAAAGEEAGEEWRSAEWVLSLCELQASLPRELRVQHGLDHDHHAVLAPEDMVQMYIDCESKSLTEYDYKKALDLTDFIQDMERRDELRLRVWVASILRDSWEGASAEEAHNNTFFRLVDLVHVMGGDLELLLPPVEDILTAPELAELVSDPRFHYIIKYGYECIDTTRNQSHELQDTR